jgi:putative NADH-flavin reductase
MKVVIFEATGMVGQGVLRGCLLDPDVESVLAIVRKASLPQHVKLREIVHQDVSDLSAIEDRLAGFDACFFRPSSTRTYNYLQVCGRLPSTGNTCEPEE